MFIIFQVTVMQLTAQIVYLYIVIPSSSPTTPPASTSPLVACLKFSNVLFFFLMVCEGLLLLVGS